MPQPRAVPLLVLFWALMFFAPMEARAVELQHTDNLRIQQIEREFALFSADWIAKINRNLISNQERIQVFFEDARFVGRYSAVKKESVSWSVKQVSYSPLTYIGRLEYLEWTFESVASTHEEALQGPFVPVKGRKVTELFRYSNNRWLK